jgi:hypothetical protein
MMNRNGFGRKQLWSNRLTLSGIFQWGLWKTTRTSVRVVDVPAEIRAEHVQIRYHYTVPIGTMASNE